MKNVYFLIISLLIPLSGFSQNIGTNCNNAVQLFCGDFIGINFTGNARPECRDNSCGTEDYLGDSRFFKVSVSNNYLSINLNIDAPYASIRVFKSCKFNDCYQISNCIAYKSKDNSEGGNNKPIDLQLNSLTSGEYLIEIDWGSVDPFGTSFGALAELKIDCKVANSCNSCGPTNNSNTIDALISCENFDSFEEGPIATQSERWIPWNANASTPVITSEKNSCSSAVPTANVVNNNSSGKSLKVEHIGNSQPDVVYSLEEKKITETLQLSWRLFIPTGKSAYYNIQPSSQQSKFYGGGVYSVYFNSNRTITLNESIIPFDNDQVYNEPFRPGFESFNISNFKYPQNRWFDVVQVFEPTVNGSQVTLVVDGYPVKRFIYKGDNQIGGINFFANNSNLYFADCICFKSVACSAFISCDPNQASCVNGIEFLCDLCGLYGVDIDKYPYENCNRYNICDLGGALINNGITYNGKLTSLDFPLTEIDRDECIQNNYGGAIPPDGKIDIYQFYYNPELGSLGATLEYSDFEQPGNFLALSVYRCNCRELQFNQSQSRSNSGDCFSSCVASQSNREGFIDIDLSDNLKEGYYYFVVSGEEGAEYDLRLIPDGPCPEGDILSFESNNETVEGSFSFASYAEINLSSQNCYSAYRNYSGNGVLYRFDIQELSTVNITLDAAEPTGIFLFQNTCGESCTISEETPPSGGTAFLEIPDLEQGTYYILVDRDSIIGSETFTLSLNTFPSSTSQFYTSLNAEDCELDVDRPHDVTFDASVGASPIRGGKVFDGTRFIFFHIDENNRHIRVDEDLWNNNAATFKLNGDPNATPQKKCSYAFEEPFLMKFRLPNDPNEVGNKPLITFTGVLDPADDRDSFLFDGLSTFFSISEVSEIDPTYLYVDPNFICVPFDGDPASFRVRSNVDWRIESVLNQQWYSIDKESGFGQETVTISFDENNDQVRSDTLLIIGDDGSLGRVTLVQKEKCPGLVVEAGSTQQIKCEVGTIQLNGTNTELDEGFQATWSTSNGNIVSGENTLNPLVDQPGDYLLTISNQVCTAQDIVSVTSETCENQSPICQNTGMFMRDICNENIFDLIITDAGEVLDFTFASGVNLSIENGREIKFDYTINNNSTPCLLANQVVTITCIEYLDSGLTTGDCTKNTGNILRQPCDDGRNFVFIQTTSGEILDVYYASGVVSIENDGQPVSFDYAPYEFQSPCSIADKAVLLYCLENAEDNNSTLTTVFSKYPWLNDIVDIQNCTGSSVEVYDNGAYAFLYVRSPNGNVLYYQDGTWYCELPDDGCLAAYSLATPSDIWSCGSTLHPSNSTNLKTKNNKHLLGKINVSPNPNTGNFTVYLPHTVSPNQDLFIHDINGKLIRSAPIKKENIGLGLTINIDNYSNGIYFLRVKTQDDNLVQKIIKH